MVEQGPHRPPWLVEEALVTGAIPGDLSDILAGIFWTVFEDGMSLTPERRSRGGGPILLGAAHTS